MAAGREAQHEATRALVDLTAGRSSSERLLELLYPELRALAAGQLRGESSGHTLQATALVHEAWLRLIDGAQVEWQGRAHFLGVAAQAMRRILVDHARAKKREKRGGGWGRVELDSAEIGAAGEGVDLVALDAALEKLRALSERQVRLVELRFFAGLPMNEVARVMDLSEATLTREWRVARAWLLAELERGEP